MFVPLKNVSRKLAMFHMFNVKHFQTISNGKFALFWHAQGKFLGKKPLIEACPIAVCLRQPPVFDCLH